MIVYLPCNGTRCPSQSFTDLEESRIQNAACLSHPLQGFRVKLVKSASYISELLISALGMEVPCAKKVRLGGLSCGEGAWRLAPLSEGQALTCLVPFSTKDLGIGAWRRLAEEAALDGVELKLRGNKSSGHKDAPQDHRSLSVYGCDSDAVQRHFMRVHDAAVDEGVDPDKCLLPEAWRARVLQVLEDRKNVKLRVCPLQILMTKATREHQKHWMYCQLYS